MTTRSSVLRSPAACTIVSRNYLSHARVLAASYAQHEPGGRFYLLVVDRLPEGVDAGEGMRVVDPDELAIPHLAEWLFQYDVTELCTAVKPGLLSLLLEKYGEQQVIYFDPDIVVARPLVELKQALASAGIVLTPHILEPTPLDGCIPSDQHILIAGAYNLGFIAIRRTPETLRFLRWWDERLRKGCLASIPDGLMTDQKWIDLVPSLFPSYAILRDETYNVAYWNIHSRKISRAGDQFLVNGRPLAFFHFSGFNPAKPEVFSHNQNRTEIRKGTAFADLLDLYRDLQMQKGFATCIKWPYDYGCFSNGEPVNLALRRVYHRLRDDERHRFGDPFKVGGPDSFLAWATMPRPELANLSAFIESLHHVRYDAAKLFPDLFGKDREGFLTWARIHGVQDIGFDPEFVRVCEEATRSDQASPAPIAAATAEEEAIGPTCSIIIPVFNKVSFTRQCLDILFSEPSEQVDFEVIVVDDASTDQTPELLAEFSDRVRCLRHEVNTGFAVTCNDGAAAAAGKYVVFLNNDTLPQPGWLDALVDYAEGHPKVAAVGSKLLFADGTIQHAGMVFDQLHMPRHIYVGLPADHPAVNKSRRYQAVTGACMLVRRNLLMKAGGFDASFHNSYEDVDLCLRLSEMGHEIHYSHRSVLYHYESVSRDPMSVEARNAQLFLERWAHRIQPDDAKYFIEDGLLTIEHRSLCPIAFKIAPELAFVSGDGRDDRCDRLLEARSEQLFTMLKENIRLTWQLQEAEFNTKEPSRNGLFRVGKRLPRKPIEEPRVVHRGDVHWLTRDVTDRIISIIIPVKNGASKLKDLLPCLMNQKCRDQIEIVAVDSGSMDGSVNVLREFGATLVSIDPQSFNHGLTRSLATRYAQGSVFVFINQTTLPADEHWLTNLVTPLETDAEIAGVCSRVLPRADADYLTYLDIFGNINGRLERIVQQLTDPVAYRKLTPHQLRLFVNFHTLSAAISADVFKRYPFPETMFGEDIMWAKAVLEVGYKLQYEPSSVAYHSHNYSFLEIFRRNFDDGLACRKILGREINEDMLLPMVNHHVQEDWQFLEKECRLEGQELEEWRLLSVLRRTAQVLGQWMGVNTADAKGKLTSLLSITEQIKAGAKTEAVNGWRM
jgi:GT2 family glycosyltransferase